MAGGGGGRTLEETPTWAVAVVCFVLVAVSIVIEHVIHLIGKVGSLVFLFNFLNSLFPNFMFICNICSG